MPNQTSHDPGKGDVIVKFNWMDLLYKVLAASVVPLVLWVFNMNTQQATQDLQIKQLQEQVSEMKGHAASLARLEEKIQSANEKLSEIKELLKHPLP